MNQTEKIALKKSVTNEFVELAESKGYEPILIKTGFVIKVNGAMVEIKAVVKKDDFDLDDGIAELNESIARAKEKADAKAKKLAKAKAKKSSDKDKG